MAIEDDLRSAAPVVRNLGSPFTTVATVMRDAAAELGRLRKIEQAAMAWLAVDGGFLDNSDEAAELLRVLRARGR